MSEEVSLFFDFLEEFEMLILLEMFGRIPVNPFYLELVFWRRFLITDFITLLVIDLFRFSIFPDSVLVICVFSVIYPFHLMVI